MEKLGSHWADFHGIGNLRIFLKSAEKIQVSLKYVKNSVCFTWELCTFMRKSKSILLRMSNISEKKFG